MRGQSQWSAQASEIIWCCPGLRVVPIEVQKGPRHLMEVAPSIFFLNNQEPASYSCGGASESEIDDR